MTTIFILNAASSLIAAAGIGGWLARRRMQRRREAALELIYVTKKGTRPLPRR
jgi:hypothetical protein